jgi:periplasmic protein TonB
VSNGQEDDHERKEAGMFDTTLIASQPKRETRRKLASLPVALAIHALAIGVVMVSQLWAVNEVPEPATVVAFVDFQPPSPPPAPPPPPPGDRDGEHDVTTNAAPPAEPVQPHEIPSEPATARGPDTGGEPGGVPGGVPGGLPEGIPAGIPGGVVGTVAGAGAPDVPIHIGGDVNPPVPLSRPAPRYPELARMARIQGVVLLEAVIEKDGSVADVRITHDLRLGCGPAAQEAVRSWRYSPATLNGRPVSVYLTIRVTFALSEVS